MITTDIQNVGGVGWWEAPLPPRKHKCTPQTTGWTSGFTLVERCACGAIRLDRRSWRERNSRQGAERPGWFARHWGSR
jgi:hypothetical protein